MTATEQIVLDRFSQSIRKGENLLRSQIQTNDLGTRWIARAPFLEWKSQSLSLLNAIYGPNDTYTVSFSYEMANERHKLREDHAVEAGIGVLRAAAEDFKNGYVWKLKERVHADIFDDYLEMADSLLSDGYEDAAAVIAGSTLESHLRALSTKNNLPITDIAGKSLKAATLNAELKRHG